MKKIKQAILLLALILLPALSQAGQWTTWHKVHIVYAYHDGRVFMALKPDHKHINPDGCSNPAYLVLKPDNKGYDQIYKMALTAKASDQYFRVYLNGCRSNNPVIEHGMMK